MLKIPSQILSLYDELLAKTAVPVRSHFLYKKWLPYYLDFCHKYHFEPSTRQNISRFLNKSEEKNQNEQQKKQAAHAISIFCEIRLPNSEKTGANKVTAKKKGLTPPGTSVKLLTNADWTSVYDSLDAEIKIRHYSPKTLKAYRGWVRQFQNFTKSKDPKLLCNARCEGFFDLFGCKTQSIRFVTKSSI